MVFPQPSRAVGIVREVDEMKRKLLQFVSYVLVAALASCATLFLYGSGGSGKLDQLEGLISQRFIGEADSQELQDAAARAMVEATGDRWSYYMSAEEYQLHVEQNENAYVGIGITISREEGEAGYRVLNVTPGSGAAEAELAVGDLLIEVEDQDVREMAITEVRNLVRGKEGSRVSMKVLRQGGELSFQVERRKVETPVATYERIAGDVGLITIENFDSRCAEETIAAIEALQADGAQCLIFDVRNNPGGYASELVKVLDYLLPEGDLFRTQRYDGKENVDMSGPDCLDIPMVVLVNASSYSAAEFFAAALQEYGAAQVVGEQTVGKGYYQVTYTLDDGSAVALSIGKYFTPKGVSLAGVGVTPDVPQTLTEEDAAALYYGTLAPEDDPNIQEAIKLLHKQ